MKTCIVSAFPACGKSFIYQNQKFLIITCSDSDSSEFSWVKDEHGTNTNVRNPNFPKNYIEHIKSLIGKVDYIFVSSHIDVRNALQENGLYYTLVLPNVNLKQEWIERCESRGNTESFIKTLDQNWDKWVTHDDTGYCLSTVRLSSGQYLVDKLHTFLSAN